MKWYTLQATDGPETGGRRVLEALLAEKAARAVLVGAGRNTNRPVTPTLVSNPEFVDSAVVFSPHQLVNAATLLARLTNDDAPVQLAAVLKPCEQRAFVELVKFSQADRSRALTLTTDCLGTVDTLEPEARVGNAGTVVEPPAEKLRPACAICAEPCFEGDLHLGFLGASTGELFVGINEVNVDDERLGRLTDLLESLGAARATAEALGARDQAVRELKDERLQNRERRFEELYEEFDDLWAFAGQFAACRQCMNCREACPICYCRECLFEGPVFEPESVRFVRWADKKGLLPLPANVLLFHMTRMNHMVLSCVGCGQCTAACPNDLPVAELFSAFGERARAVFGYEPGLSFDDPPPLTTFRHEELPHVTEPREKVMSQ